MIVGLVLLLLLVPVAVDLVRRPTFRRLAFRNIDRRRGEAALVIVGSLLGTAIITASFVVGDTVEGSVRDAARTHQGPIDLTVRLLEPSQLDALQDALGEQPIDGTDGTLVVTSVAAVAASVGPDRVAVPNAGLIEIDFDEGRSLGPDPAITGLADAGPTPTGDEAVISELLATKLGVGAGDSIEVFAYGGSTVLTVRQIVPEVGIAGYAPVGSARGQGQPRGVFVAPGTIEELAAGATGDGTVAPTAEIVVSGVGGVFDGADGSAAVAAELEARTEGIDGRRVLELKADLLRDAKAEGDQFGQLFATVGYFSVIAGILLLVNLFVMLSEERKAELGMLRALGFKRNHLVRTFAIEGSVYSVVASILGAIVGVGVSWVIILVAAGIFSQNGSELSFPLVVEPASLVAGAVLGLAISMVTVWGTSARIARLNIISAIRDLPENRHARRGLVSLALGLLGAAVGVALFASGWSSGRAAAVLAGPAIAAFCLIPVLTRFLPRKPVIVVLAGAALAWGVLVFTVAGDRVGGAEISVFVVQGVILVGAGVTLLAQADRLWAGLAKVLASGGGGLATRLGLAYPLARIFRTSLLLAMFALVIFTMTFISVISGIFGNQIPQITDDMRAGHDLIVESNQANPVSTDQLASFADVESVAPLTRAQGIGRTPRNPDGTPVPVSGFDERFLELGQPALEARDAAFASDADAFRAVLDADDLVIVNQSFAAANLGGGPPQANLVVGDTISVANPASQQEQQLRVVGIMGSDGVRNGALLPVDLVEGLLAPRFVQNRHYVEVADGADAEQVAARISGTFIANGADATTFRSLVSDQLASQQGFFSLLRGYLGLGLLIGIAGLGVVMVRAVRERRRQIGMLRAMGVSSRIVRRAFVLEAAFVAMQGIVLGVVLGMVTSYNLLVNSSAFGEQPLDFAWPWAALAVIVVVPLVASLLATAWPATQAARIKPAVALRIAD